MIIALILLAGATSFIAWNFCGLYPYGELTITEPIIWVRTFEFILSLFIAVSSVGLLMGYAYERGRCPRNYTKL